MSKLTEIRRKLKELMGDRLSLPINCKVVSVEGNSCTVELNGGFQLADVRLMATVNDDNNQFLITPKIGSKALVFSVSGTLDDLVLLKCDQVAKMSYVQDGLEVVIDSSTGKVSVKNDLVSLKDLFVMVHDLIMNLKVMGVGVPPGSLFTSNAIDPGTIASLTNLQMKFQSLLN